MIHVITYGEKHKQTAIQKSLKSFGLTYKFHLMKKHPTDEHLGRIRAHLELYRYAEKQNLTYLWVMEDDVIPTKDTIPDSVWENIDHFLSLEDWKVLFLGGKNPLMGTFQQTSLPSLYKTSADHGFHSYIIHYRGWKTYLEQDTIPNLYTNQNYIVYPALFDPPSSIFYPTFIRRLHEWLIHRGWMSKTMILVICLVITLFVIWSRVKK